MPASSDFQIQPFDIRLLDDLACPVCFGALALMPSSGEIVCAGCRRTYPLIDGIPVLIADRAKTPAAE